MIWMAGRLFLFYGFSLISTEFLQNKHRFGTDILDQFLRHLFSRSNIAPILEHIQEIIDNR